MRALSRALGTALVVACTACGGGSPDSSGLRSTPTPAGLGTGSPSPTALVTTEPSASATAGSPSARPVGTRTVSPTHPPSSPGPTRTSTMAAVTVDESDANGTVRVHRGARLHLVLHSTYWTIGGSTDDGVVTAAGNEQHEGQNDPSCVPGQGCGSVSRDFNAVGVGSARLSATRSVCGEALACTAEQRSYAVTIVVE